VVFADLSGFTALSERMDPEDVRSLIDGCMAKMGEIVSRFGGSVDKVVGDELMALFGAPTAHGDDSERAVLAALEMHRCAAEHAEDFGAMPLRIGVNTGEVMFAPVGPEGARGFTVMGDPVNVASRLRQAADPGGTLVGEETYRATRRAVTYEPVEPLQVKGKEAPLPAWLALEPVVAPADRPLSAARVVGRNSELELLRATWDRVVAERRPHLVTVLGPPGIGKTRLSQEFVSLVEASGGRTLKGRSLPYGETAGYRAFAQFVKEVAGIFESDAAPVAREKLSRAVTALLPAAESGDVASRLVLLTGLGTERAGADKGPLFSSARRFVEATASQRPTAFVLEDVHWSDPSLLDLVEFLAGRCRDAPALFLTLARPELLDSRPGWGGGLASSTVLELQPLTSGDSRELIASLLPGMTDQAAIDRVVETAGGNPLFIEELAASVAERATEMATTLPTTVQAIIAARLDALPAAEREVIFDASVVGKIFWRGALARLGTEDGLDQALDSLEAKDLIRPEPASRLQGDREFSFKHMLIREVAYATLPRAARRERHAAVACFVEDAAGDRLAEAASLLAHHWREARDDQQTLRFLVMAAEHASRTWAKSEAVSLYTQALELVPGGDGARRRSLLLRRGITLLESGKFPAAAGELDAVLPELEGHEQAEALLGRSRLGYWLSDPDTAESSSRRAAELAESLGDDRLRSRAKAAMSVAATLDGHALEAVALGEQALTTWPPGVDAAELAIHLGFLGAFHYWVGGYERAAELSQRGYDLGTEVHAVEGMLVAGGDLGMALTGLGRHEEALQVLQRVVAQGRELELVPSFTSRAMNMWAGTLRELFDLGPARRLNEEAIELAGRAGFTYGEVQGKIDLLVTDLAEGDVGQAERTWPALWEATLVAKGLHRWLMPGRLTTARAEIDLAIGDAEAAAAAAAEAITHAQKHGRLKYEVVSRAVLGAALLEMGHPEAVAELRRALAGAERLAHPPSVWRALSLLGRALLARGDDDGAAAALGRAQETVKRFAATLSEERCEHFLAAPRIAEILAGDS
jgi:class 3 adenylate cyclase/tetratricopeptide (TPR) repeat protein